MSQTLSYFKALADETRLRLLHVLHRYELSVNELVGILGMGQSRVSRHLKILSEAGLLHWRRDGLWVFYSGASEGQGQRFIQSVMPFVGQDTHLTAEFSADLAAAARCIEERAQKTRLFFNAIAEDWDALNREVLGGFDLAGAVCAAVPVPCGLAVDLGCGTGSVLERLLPLAQGVIGVDGSSRMLELARRRFAPEHVPSLEEGGRVSLRIGELDHLPLRDNEAHFACINLVLHHLSSPVAALREIQRILRPGGLLHITDFDKHNNEKMRELYGDRWLGFDSQTLSDLLNEAGLHLRQIRREPVEKGLGLLLALAEK